MPDSRDLDAADPVAGASEQLENRPYDPTRDRERVRGLIALVLTALFCALVLALFVTAAAGWLGGDSLDKLAAVLLSPVSGLLGAVTGFYYGEQSARNGR